MIEVGMPVEALVELIGEPDSVRPYGNEEVEGVELWIYEQKDSDTEMVSTDMEERLYIDPITGEERTVFENIMSPEVTVRSTTTIFLIAEGAVRAWKVEREEDSFL